MSLSTIKRRENYLCTWHWDLAKKKPNSPQFFIKLDVNSWFWTFAKACLRRLIIAIEDLTKHFKNMKCHNVWHIYTTVTHSQFWEGSQSVLLDLCPSLLKAAGQRQWCLVRPRGKNGSKSKLLLATKRTSNQFRHQTECETKSSLGLLMKWSWLRCRRKYSFASMRDSMTYYQNIGMWEHKHTNPDTIFKS